MSKIIQIALHNGRLVALCEDGTLWLKPLTEDDGFRWVSISTPSDDERSKNEGKKKPK